MPAFRVTETVDLPPFWTIWPLLFAPPPLTATPCGTDDGLSIVIVTLPALADSELLSNFSAPLGSAARLRLELAAAPPPDEVEPVAPVEPGAPVAPVLPLAAGAELVLDKPPPPPPQPANARAAMVAPRTSSVGLRINN